jgi:hypothetical protein
MTDTAWKEFLDVQEKQAQTAFRATKAKSHPVIIQNTRSLSALPTVGVLFESYCKTHNIIKGTPEAVFAGNCHSVARELMKFLGKEARLVRGHWIGSKYPKQHSWLEYRGKIIDPTRFQFENKSAYIFKGLISDPHYDKFSCSLRSPNYRDLPPREGQLFRTQFTHKTRAKLNQLLYNDRDWHFWTKEEIMYIANMPPKDFGKSFKSIFSEIIRRGYRAAIPIDILRYFGLENV